MSKYEYLDNHSIRHIKSMNRRLHAKGNVNSIFAKIITLSNKIGLRQPYN